MASDYIEQPVKFPTRLFRRLLALQQSKNLSIEGIIIPLLDKLVPKTGSNTKAQESTTLLGRSCSIRDCFQAIQPGPDHIGTAERLGMRVGATAPFPL